MNAALFEAFGQPLRIGDVAEPEAGRGQVLLKVCRCGICGSDLHMTEDPTFGLQGGEVIGHEFSGQVIDVGAGVTHLKPGDHVSAAPLKGCGSCPACLRGEPAWCAKFELIGGGFAEFAALDEAQCRKLPWGISAADGALAEPLGVALHGILRAKMSPGGPCGDRWGRGHRACRCFLGPAHGRGPCGGGRYARSSKGSRHEPWGDGLYSLGP